MSHAYRLVRSRRKTLSVQVRDGEVVVRAPLRASQGAIDAFVQSRAQWIRRHQQNQQHQIRTLGVRLEQGGCLPWQGQMLGLSWQRGAVSGVELNTDHFHVTLSPRVRRDEPEAVADQLKRWFSQQAAIQLLPRSRQLAEHTGLVPRQVDIGSWRGRWGQCSSRGEVKLNWRLLQLSPELQDYVILHELCHLRHMHHGPEFHALLRHHCDQHPRLHREMQQFTPWLKW